MPIKSFLSRYQAQNPLPDDELKRLFKKSAMENNLLVIDLKKVNDLNFRLHLMEYAERELQVILSFRRN